MGEDGWLVRSLTPCHLCHAVDPQSTARASTILNRHDRADGVFPPASEVAKASRATMSSS